MPIEQKKSKIIVRDNDGELVQLLPETDASQVNYGNTNLQSAIDEMAGNEVEQVYAEIDPHSKTETRIEHRVHEGTIVPYSRSVAFSIGFIYSTENEGTISYSTTNLKSLYIGNATVPSDPSITYPSSFKSNVEYVLDFTLDPAISYKGFQISTDWHVTLEDESRSNYGYYIYPQSNAFPNSTYQNVNDNDSFVSASLDVGTESTFKFNCKQKWEPNSYSVKEIPENEQNMRISIANLDGTNYQLKFYWDYSEDVEVVEETRWKELKTTTERKDGSKTEVNKPISGLLQNVSLSTESSYELEPEQLIGTYYPYITIVDSGIDL